MCPELGDHREEKTGDQASQNVCPELADLMEKEKTQQELLLVLSHPWRHPRPGWLGVEGDPARGKGGVG